MPPPTYRERLRREGATLAAAGALGSTLLLVLVAEASAHAASTAAQIAFVALVLAVVGPRFVRRWLAAGKPVAPGAQLTGEPTALWKPPLVVVVLSALFLVPGQLGFGRVAWDAGLRITLGCLLVGLAQALWLERVVAADEARTGRRYVRLPGSSAASGTNLGFVLSPSNDQPGEEASDPRAVGAIRLLSAGGCRGRLSNWAKPADAVSRSASAALRLRLGRVSRSSGPAGFL